MIKQIFEEKEVTKIEKVVVEEKLLCDVCNKEIDRRNGYYELTTSHSDWGNDSVDSINNFDICGEECLHEKFKEYIDYSDGGINTQRFEVEHRH